MIVALMLAAFRYIVIIALLIILFYIGIKKKDKVIITTAIVLSVLIAFWFIPIPGNDEESASETTYKTIIIDGTEYELVPSGQ